MKKIFTLVVLISVFVACKKDSNILDSTHPLILQGQIATRSVDSVIDSVLNVVTKTYMFQWVRNERVVVTFLGVDDNYLEANSITRDEANSRLLFAGGYVIDQNHQLGSFITSSKDFIFVAYLDSLGNTVDPKLERYMGDWTNDTIGYIPSGALKVAQEAIIAAFDREDYEACYSLFDSAFVFVPTTGAEYRRLKEAGIE